MAKSTKFEQINKPGQAKRFASEIILVGVLRQRGGWNKTMSRPERITTVPSGISTLVKVGVLM